MVFCHWEFGIIKESQPECDLLSSNIYCDEVVPRAEEFV